MFSWSRKQSSSLGRRGGADASMDSSSRSGGGSGSGSRGRSPRLDRRNAAKHIDYEVGTGASSSAGASWSSSSSMEQQRSLGLRPSRSLDLAPGPPGADFRISGSAEGEVDELCRSLGLSGPEEFAIPVAAWEARKARSNSDLLPRSRLVPSPPADELSPVARSVSASEVQPPLSVPAPIPEESLHSSSTSTATDSAEEPSVAGPENFAIPVAAWEARSSDLPRSRLVPSPPADELSPVARSVSAPEVQPPLSVPAPIPEESFHSSSTSTATDSAEEPSVAAPEKSPKAAPAVAVVAPIAGLPLPSPRRRRGEVGIRGARPPVLSPPPPITALASPPVRRSFVADDVTRSAWDIVQSFAPREERSELGGAHERVDTGHMSDTEEEDEVEDGVAAVERELKELRIEETFEGFTGTSSLSTTNDDDASSTTTEAMFIISPNGKFKRNIKSWMRGVLLGSGSFGMVYEGISDEGAFFAVKEVSLLDQGNNAQQSILALEQEIALLSQFEHENIVQYYGTDKEESKLYIFIELVTQGSLSSLYQKYKLRESQVSAYTRQILNGLVYLHERNVVHRDIKCANILVHANGSVKLADFGLAKEMSKINMLRSCKGSVYWMAPEVINPKKMYGPSADIWSLGCTVLEMLTRQVPFPNVEWTNAFFMIGRGEQPPIPSYLSKEAQDFIGQCVRVDPEKRPSASQLLEHPFVNRPLRASFESSSPPANDRVRY
ncbi:mitogen-activated protein kinase kinase kinase 1-like [Phragmites australis]|uniref:mitogen-activated protein kinase kinase kinase 1-like n=1 Tax=Phragmites australis TaxID=29695 RepID=UPI002D79B1A0|nr:mitogen-activated protein kinase kinase kinase 1-like [Phragmites australis]